MCLFFVPSAERVLSRNQMVVSVSCLGLWTHSLLFALLLMREWVAVHEQKGQYIYELYDNN